MPARRSSSPSPSTSAGRQLAVAALPNRYETLARRRRRAGHGAHLGRYGDHAALARRQGAGPRRPHRRDRRDRTGRRHLADRQGRRAGRQGWLWLDARAAAIVEEIRARPDDRRHFEKTGTGLAACQQRLAARLDEAQPARDAGRAATAFHCKDWLYFKLTGERATDPSEGTFTFGDFRTRELFRRYPRSARRRTISSHLLPPIVDGTRQSAGLSPAGCRRHRAAGRHAGRARLCRRVCTGARRRPLRPRARAGLHHHRLDRHAHAPRRDARRGAAQRRNDRLHDAVARSGRLAQMQSNMAATLNIDWLLDLASRHPRLAGHRPRIGRDDRAGRRMDRFAPVRPRCSTIPISRRPASAARSSTPTRGRGSSASRRGMAMAT